MRYAALNQGADNLESYGKFIPGTKDFLTLPDPSKLLRNSDEQLYALALYIYSLEPPPNPNKFDRLAARGQKFSIVKDVQPVTHHRSTRATRSSPSTDSKYL